MKFLLNGLIANHSSFVNLINDKISIILTPIQKKVVLIAMAVFTLFAIFYFSYSSKVKKLEVKEDEPITLKKGKAIEERLLKNRNYAQAQQIDQEAKGFELERELFPKSISVFLGCEGNIVGESKKISSIGDVGVASCQGWRDTMEDADIADEGSFKVKDKEYPFQIFGICDGHGGSNASAFVKANFNIYLKEALEGNNQEKLTDEGIFKALRACFQKLDADYTGSDGTTATIAMILNGKIWVANVGDSRTILVKDGQATQASEDAKPSIGRYKKKIEGLGGLVIGNLVNGILAVARAIGDKEIVGAEGECCVCPNPKTACYSLKDFKGGYLVLGCDGLYDIATTNEVGKAIQQMDEKRQSAEEMSRRLVFSAIKRGSRDNVSIVVVKL